MNSLIGRTIEVKTAGEPSRFPNLSIDKSTATSVPLPGVLLIETRPAVHLDDRADDRKAQPGSCRARLVRLGAAVEALEDVGQLGGVDAHARCRPRELSTVVRGASVTRTSRPAA